jgi:hypothetical protein
MPPLSGHRPDAPLKRRSNSTRYIDIFGAGLAQAV